MVDVVVVVADDDGGAAAGAAECPLPLDGDMINNEAESGLGLSRQRYTDGSGGEVKIMNQGCRSIGSLKLFSIEVDTDVMVQRCMFYSVHIYFYLTTLQLLSILPEISSVTSSEEGL